jgi:hypothetical protein
MSDDLDPVIRALRSAPPGRDLRTIEPLVWRRLDDEAGWAFFGLSPAHAVAAARASLAAIALISGLAVGAAVGGRAAGPPAELAVFSADALFGPSAT